MASHLQSFLVLQHGVVACEISSSEAYDNEDLDGSRLREEKKKGWKFGDHWIWGGRCWPVATGSRRRAMVFLEELRRFGAGAALYFGEGVIWEKERSFRQGT
uniref:Uncharacterized protein n=1 Tax=Arundo donax TaxID=35708 RepID=A0A0A9GKP6_ARUDO